MLSLVLFACLEQSRTVRSGSWLTVIATTLAQVVKMLNNREGIATLSHVFACSVASLERHMRVSIVDCDLLDQNVEVIVNAWNRNIIPWWLLIPQGVSGAIKKRGGLQPFRELGRMGPIRLGHAVETSPGNLPFRSIIHVAGISMLWRSSERSIRDSVRNAVSIAQYRGYQSLALPLIGAGSGGGNATKVQAIIEDELTRCHFDGEIRIVRYLKTAAKKTPSQGATL